MRKIAKVFALFLIFGCGQQPELSIQAGKDLVIVNGEHYTEADLQDDVEFRFEMVKVRNKGKPVKEAQVLSSISNSVILGIVPSKLLAIEFKRCNIAVSEERMAECKKKYLHTFGDQVFGNPRFRQHLEGKMRDEAMFEAYCRKFYYDDYFVPTGLVAKTRRDMLQWNRDVPLTNALFMATASNIVKRVRAGEDFAELADSFSQERNKIKGGEYGKIDAEETRDVEGLWESLSKLKLGEVLGPIVTPEGIIVYHCNRPLCHDDETGNDTVEVSRIVFYPAMEFPQYTDAQIEKEISQDRRADVMGKIMRKLIPDAKITFPNGLGVFPRFIQMKLRSLYQKNNKQGEVEK